MRIVCDSCGTKYSISDDKVRGKVFKIRCKNCSHVIIVRGDGSGAAADAGGGAAAAAPQASASAEAVWYIVRGGQQDGPYTIADIEGFIASGEANADTYAWREGFADWVPMSAAEGLNQLLHSPAPAKAAAPASALMPAPGFHDEGHGAASDDGFEDDGESTRVVDSSKFNPPPADPDPAPMRSEPAPVASYSEPEPAYQEPAPLAAAAPVALAGGAALGGAAVGGMAMGGFGNIEPTDSPSLASDIPSLSGMGSLAGASLDAAFSQEPVPQAPKPSNGVNSRNGHMVGSRNEDSVLFSLNTLSSVGPTTEEAPTNTEASGLIDIRALQSSNAAVTGGRNEGPESAGVAAAIGGPSQSAPAIAVPAMMPMGTRKSNWPLFLAIGGGLLFILLLIGVIVGLVVFRDTDTKVVEVDKSKDPAVVAANTTKNEGDPAEKGEEKAVADKGDEKAEGDDKGDEEGAIADKGDDKGDEKGDEVEGDDKGEEDSVKDAPKVPKVDNRTAAEKAKDRDEREKRLAKLAEEKERERARAKEEKERNKNNNTGKGGNKDNIDDILDGIGGKKKPPKREEKVEKKKDPPVDSGAKKSLSKSEVQRVIRGAYGRVSACNSNQADKKSGTVTVRFTIQPSGSVGGAQVTGAMAGTPVGGCISRVVRGLRFPRFDGSPLTITFPFRLR